MGYPNKIKPYTEMYKGIIKDVHDPERAGRVKVYCSAVHADGEYSEWCPVSLPPHYYTVLYEEYPVWVTFRDGDPAFPIVMGMRLRHDGKYTSMLFRDFSEGPYKEDLKDATEHAVDSWDSVDHKLVPGHGHPPYYDPYLSVFHYKQGARWGVNEEPGEQGTFWYDRIGQGLRTVGDPINPLDPHEETRGMQRFSSKDLDSQSTLYTEEGWRSLIELWGTHGQYLQMRVKDKDGEEETELLNTNSRNDNYGSLLLSNLLKRNSLVRIAPGREVGFEQVLDPKNPTKANQRIYDWNGQEIYMESAAGKQKIHVRVPGGEITTWDNIKGSIISKDRYGNSHEMSSAGIKLNAYTEYKLNANTNITQTANINVDIKANVNATVKGQVLAKLEAGTIVTVQGGAMARIDAPLVMIGKSPSLPVARMTSVVMTMVGPGTVITGSPSILVSAV